MEMSKTWARAKQGAWVSALLLSAAQGAVAQDRDECADDVDCGAGFVCETYDQGCPEIAIACADGEKCPAPEPCNAQPIHVCVPGPCSSDADCGDSMVCYTQTFMRCEGGGSAGCAPDEKCEPEQPVEDTCTTETLSQCVPPWVPPCGEDADCGPGFRCVEEISRGCSGSAGRPTPDDGEPAPPPPPPMCFENPTGRFICELIETACSSDDDCDAGLKCASNPSYPVCGGATPADGADDGDGDRDSAGAADRACPEPSAPMRVCLPPDYAYDLDRGGSGQAESGNSGGEPTSAPAPSKDGSSDEKGDTDDAADAAAPRLVSHGCSAAGAGSSHWLAFAGWLLIAAAPLRRRKRA